MAVRHQVIERSPLRVWDVLADPSLFSRWVVGVSDSGPGEGTWPELDSKLVYKISLGPWTGTGRTVVRRVEPPYILELEADSGPLGTARIAIEVRPWGRAESIVVIDEHPLRGSAGTLHNVAVDGFLQVRHRSMLNRLAEVVEESGDREPEPSAP
ncbi:SRPBCC family protein [Streptomyces polygonati]|uniref:SRPBCC family protein n=1 Tax=Streptomyces polygonati TaxID=1617087 RepID=A0ABV8HM27_9ACTN